MTFEELGSHLDDFLNGIFVTHEKFQGELEDAIGVLATSSPWLESRRLAEDAANQGYDLVERNDVRVERDDDTLVCKYNDGSEWNRVTKYDSNQLAGETA